MDEIVDAFIETEIEFEEAFEHQEMQVIIIPESMNVVIQNMKPTGTRRYNLKREPFSPELQEYVL